MWPYSWPSLNPELPLLWHLKLQKFQCLKSGLCYPLLTASQSTSTGITILPLWRAEISFSTSTQQFGAVLASPPSLINLVTKVQHFNRIINIFVSDNLLSCGYHVYQHPMNLLIKESIFPFLWQGCLVMKNRRREPLWTHSLQSLMIT